MLIETFGPRRLRLTLASVPLELWPYFDPGYPPMAVWLDAVTGKVVAEVPVVGAN